VRVFRADGAGQPVLLKGNERAVLAMAFHPDGQRLATAGSGREIRLFRADGTGEPGVVRAPADVCGVAFSPDGGHLAYGLRDGTLRITNADGTGEPVVLRGQEAVACLGTGKAFRPDGSALLSTSEDGSIRIFRTDGTGEPVVLRALDGNTQFNSAEWSPDGRRIVAASTDKTVWVWSDFEPPQSSDEPRLWTATRYCPPVEERRRLLGVTEEAARSDLALCEQRVRDASPAKAEPR